MASAFRLWAEFQRLGNTSHKTIETLDKEQNALDSNIKCLHLTSVCTEDYNELKVGDLIEIFRTVYRHWVLYVGNGYVIHLTPPSEVCNASASSIMSVFTDKAYVRKEPLHHVTGTDRCRVNNKLDGRHRPRPAHIIMKEAYQYLGQEMEYNLHSANCEHFVMYLRYGVSKSTQVDDVETAVGVGVGVGLFGLAAGLCYQLMKPQQKHKK